MGKWVYSFGDGKAEGRGEMRNLLGGKGANLAEMANLGLAGAAGLHHHHRALRAITTPTAKPIPPDLKAQVDAALIEIGAIANRTFGDPANPLLVSVRSGARASMPGMMDTVLNLGLNDVTVRGAGRQLAGDERFAWDSYRRFIQMYSERGARHSRTTISKRFSKTTKTARTILWTPT